MTTIIQIGTTNYEDDIISIKIALSHLQTNCEVQDGFEVGQPVSKFGWTFFPLLIKPHFHYGIEQKFADMIQKYKGKNEEKFLKFMSDFFEAKGSKVSLKLIES